MKKNLLLILTAGMALLMSCKSKQEQAKDEMNENINIAYTLLDIAATQPETDLHVPMGFTLDCKKSEFDKRCNDWIEKNGGRHEGSLVYLKTKEFGSVEREVRMSMFPYFSDPNTETDIVAEISFIFDEFRENKDSNGGWQVLRDSICKKFDDSWETAEFNLDDADTDRKGTRYDYSNKYYKYWVRGNMAVQFNYEGMPGYATLSFYNVPKYGTKFFKDNVKMVLDIHEEVKQKIEREKNLPKIQNSPWDGSVYQVENYLKKNLKDPDSYQSIEWSSVAEKDGNYQVRHKYRAKNSFGGYVVENCIFTLNKEGNVIDVLKLQ